jgi:hypothetical protein
MLIALVVLAAACSPAETPTPTPRGSPVPADALAPQPDAALYVAFRDRHGAFFTPLLSGDPATVFVSTSQAEQVAVASGGMGYQLDDGAEAFTPWVRAGFVYIGRWTPAWEPHLASPVPMVAYAVQVFTEDVPELRGATSALVIVDATSGEVSVTLSPCDGPLCQ